MKELLVSLLVWVIVMVGIYFITDWMVSSKYKNCPLPAEMYSSDNSCHYSGNNGYLYYGDDFRD